MRKTTGKKRTAVKGYMDEILVSPEKKMFIMGLVLGMLIVGLPQFIAVAILLSMLVLSLKLVEKGRL